MDWQCLVPFAWWFYPPGDKMIKEIIYKLKVLDPKTTLFQQIRLPVTVMWFGAIHVSLLDCKLPLSWPYPSPPPVHVLFTYSGMISAIKSYGITSNCGEFPHFNQSNSISRASPADSSSFKHTNNFLMCIVTRLILLDNRGNFLSHVVLG